VIDENTELDPFVPASDDPAPGFAPPAPTVTVKLAPIENDVDVLYPPAPDPPD
jgi:hypothetical protein